jgi:YHS domain-containing protein
MINRTRRLFLASATILVSTPAFAAADEIYTSFFSNAGAGGYDVVAYFTDGKPVKGNDKYFTEYKDAEWVFSSQENLDKFKLNPDMYAPQYGGYCAWAVANGSTASGDPLHWSVVNNKLYLNYDADIQAMWADDRNNLIVMGDKNWPGVLN